MYPFVNNFKIESILIKLFLAIIQSYFNYYLNNNKMKIQMAAQQVLRLAVQEAIVNNLQYLYYRSAFPKSTSFFRIDQPAYIDLVNKNFHPESKRVSTMTYTENYSSAVKLHMTHWIQLPVVVQFLSVDNVKINSIINPVYDNLKCFKVYKILFVNAYVHK